MADVKQLLMFNKFEYCMYPHTPHQDRRVLFHRVTQRHELIWHKRAARSLSCQSVCVCWLKGLFQSFLRSGRFWVTLRILNGPQESTVSMYGSPPLKTTNSVGLLHRVSPRSVWCQFSGFHESISVAWFTCIYSIMLIKLYKLVALLAAYWE